MTGRIGTWHRRYRVCGTADHRRADALASGPVLAAYEDALRRVFGSDPTVVLVRQVDAKFTINLGVVRPPAETWGRAMAAAVVRAITTDPGSGNVVRFADEAAHLAAFVAEVADGLPADGWVFDRFKEYRHADPAATLRDVLFQHPGLIAGTVRRLAATGRLAPVLRRIGPIAAAWLWSNGISREAAPAADADRPLFAAALQLVEALTGTRPDRKRAEEAFAAFLATRSAPTAWRDPGTLAEVVAAAVRFLAFRLGVAWLPESSAFEQAVGRLDWVDVPRLKEQLLEPPGPRGSTSRPRVGLTARQRLWFDALRVLAPRIGPDLDRSDLRSPANALLVFAALTADHPEWADDPAVPGFVAAVLAAAADDAGGNALVRQWGEAAAPLVRALAGRASLTVAVERGERTAAAGVFLLLRAALDLRLPALALRSAYPAAGPVGPWRFMAALAAKWAGVPLEAEPGILAFAGIAARQEAELLRVGWADAREGEMRFQRGFAAMLLAQRLPVDPKRLRAALVPDAAGEFVVVGGDEPLAVWPFAAPVDSPRSAGPLLARWATAWQELTGSTPTVIHPAAILPPPGFPAEACEADPDGLAAVFAAFAAGTTGTAHADATLTAVAAAGVRGWSRWLKHIGHSSIPYLLDHLIRRSGRLLRSEQELVVELEPRPFDVVLQLSGYLDPIELPPGGPLRSVRFRVGGPG